jgi:ubiquinone/menaquinone biosynthesis C-methylase UbiE
MSKLGEILLLTLNRWMPRSNQALTSAKLDPADYVEFFGQRSESSFTVLGPLDLTGKNILDVGCGLGANLVYLCKQGAKRLTALDINPAQVLCAQTILANRYPEYLSHIDFVSADAANMPFADQSFDALVSADTFEHVDNLRDTLLECFRVLRPGGQLYIFFPPFYAPWGAHMINWINLPWCQILFAESTILNVARRLEREGTAINNQLPPETRLDLQDGNVIPFISRLTLCRFRHVLRTIPTWKVVRVRLLPPGWRTDNRVSHLIQPLARVPILKEVFTARAVYVLEKSLKNSTPTEGY